MSAKYLLFSIFDLAFCRYSIGYVVQRVILGEKTFTGKKEGGERDQGQKHCGDAGIKYEIEILFHKILS